MVDAWTCCVCMDRLLFIWDYISVLPLHHCAMVWFPAPSKILLLSLSNELHIFTVEDKHSLACAWISILPEEQARDCLDLRESASEGMHNSCKTLFLRGRMRSVPGFGPVCLDTVPFKLCVNTFHQHGISTFSFHSQPNPGLWSFLNVCRNRELPLMEVWQPFTGVYGLPHIQ